MNYLTKIEELKSSRNKCEILKLYHEIEEKWFNIKRFNDKSAILHKDTANLNIFYDQICELVVNTNVIKI